jgi:YD repeat-containing protein
VAASQNDTHPLKNVPPYCRCFSWIGPKRGFGRELDICGAHLPGRRFGQFLRPADSCVARAYGKVRLAHRSSCRTDLTTYDSNGNTLTSVTGSNTTTYAWDFENRLSSVTLQGSGGTVSFKYDPFGRRIYKFSLSGTSVFTYDGGNLIEETSSTGAVVARYEQTENIFTTRFTS